jgi:hypothetical protein
MSNIRDLSLSQLRRAVEIKEKIESLEQELATLTGGSVSSSTTTNGTSGKRTMSASARARIRAAQIARWARVKGTSSETKAPAPAKKRKVSSAVKARLAEIARKRWAAAKAAGKSAL